jgi:hypothetical protein
MDYRRRGGAILLCLAVVCTAVPAYAQPLTRAEIDERVDESLRTGWDKALAEAARELKVPLNANNRVVGTDEQRRQVFEAALARVEADTSLIELFTPAYVQALIDERP